MSKKTFSLLVLANVVYAHITYTCFTIFTPMITISTMTAFIKNFEASKVAKCVTHPECSTQSLIVFWSAHTFLMKSNYETTSCWLGLFVYSEILKH